MKQGSPTPIRLKPEESDRIERVQKALSKTMGDAPITRAHTIHVLLARGYEVLAKELGLEGTKK